jgi:hypothetical protein
VTRTTIRPAGSPHKNTARPTTVASKILRDHDRALGIFYLCTPALVLGHGIAVAIWEAEEG